MTYDPVRNRSTVISVLKSEKQNSYMLVTLVDTLILFKNVLIHK